MVTVITVVTVVRLAQAVRDKTTALMEEINKAEREIDERVAGLYGL